MNNIELIAIEELQHHPDNPRKDFGDLTELAESIKTNGIMQNLTVVRSEDGTGLYDVIIGNRRLEAAKIAGLYELPCAVVELEPQEQMATMLAENMQREDLTVLEQAQGFQYMLDLGEDITSISEKTGFSKSTVRRRVKLLELDKTELEKAFKRQISLEDIDKINSIDDITERNKLLDYAGTGNFNWAFRCAQRNQDEMILFDKIRKIMSLTDLEEVESNTQWGANRTKERVGYIGLEGASKKDEDLQKAVDEGIEKYGEKSDSYAFEHFGLYFLVDRKEEDTQAETAEDKKRDEENARRAKNAELLLEASANAFELRCEFIKNYTKTQAKKHYKVIIAALARMTVQIEDADWNGDMYCFNNEIFEELSEIETETQSGFESSSAKIINDAPEKLLLNFVYSLFNDDKRRDYAGWDGGCNDHYGGNAELDYLYKFLGDLGYEMSDVEKSLQDGTNELYYKPDAEGDSNGK